MSEQVQIGRQQRFWRTPTEYLLYLLVVCAIALGGAPNAANWQIMAICAIAAVLLPFAVAAGGADRFTQLPGALRLGVVLLILIPLVQLIPLPPGIWQSLPGRSTAESIFGLMGTHDQWHPISLTPRDTLFAFLMLLPPAAAFLAALTLTAEGRRRAVWVLIVAALVSMLIGLVQFGTKGTSLDFYNTAHRGSFLGFFANRNHQGLLMGIGGAFAIAAVKQRIRDQRLAIATAGLLAMVFFVAAVGTLSRAGIGLTFLGLSIAFYACFIHGKLRWPVLLGGAAAVLTGLYFVTFSSTVRLALDRFSQIEENGRLEIWQRSWPLIEQFVPWGAGVGSYTSVYPGIEQLGNVTGNYYNRVHNEYLEILIESGVPGVLVLALISFVAIRHAIRALRGRVALDSYALPGAITIALVALHSIVDYPLRTQSIAVVFALAGAFFLAPTAKRERNGQVIEGASHGERSIRFKAVGLVGQGVLLLGFALFVQFQEGAGRAIDRSVVPLANPEGEAMPSAELALAKRVLARQPLDQSLLNIVYTSEARAGIDEGRRREYVEVLRALGWRDTATQQNLMFEAARENDITGMLDRIDALLRRGKIVDQILPFLIALESDARGREELAQRLAQSPSWRRRYFSFSEVLNSTEILDGRLQLIAYMEGQGLPVDRLELAPTLAALMRARRHSDVVQLARTQLPAKKQSQLLFDPDFEQLASIPNQERISAVAYEWRTISRSGASAQIIAEEWDSRLALRWNGRGAPVMARALTFLKEGVQPGLEIELSAGSPLRGLDSLRFTLACPGAKPILFIRSPIGRNADPRQDRTTAYFVAEESSPCDYPELLVGGQPQLGGRGIDLSLDSVRLLAQ